MDKRFRVLVLGAGFSKPAGLPLAQELWAEIRSIARSFVGRAGKFQQDVDRYLEFKLDTEGIELDEDKMDFEEFCRFLDIEHFLGLKGSDTWSVDGNETTVVVKTLIGKILTDRTPEIEDVPELYLEFARRLQPDDYVLTFNYDILLERALDAVSKPYRLFPWSHKPLSSVGAEEESPANDVVVLKLHGSVDWFDRTQYSWLQNLRKEQGFTGRPVHPVFGDDGDDLEISPLLDDPESDDNPLSQMYRVHTLKALYARLHMFQATPWLLAPSTMKILYAEKLRDFWYGQNDLGAINLGAAVVGYSLPAQDTYAHQAVYSFITNYQREWWNQDVLGDGRKKAPLVIVDHCTDKAKLDVFRTRYRFVDWTRTDFLDDGFSEESLDRIFNA